MTNLLQEKPTVENLAVLKLLDGVSFYRLNRPQASLHLLLGQGSDLEHSVNNTKVSFSTLADSDDKAERLERFDCWVSDVELFISNCCKAGEHVVLLAGRTIEDALGLLYDQTFDTPLLAAELSRYGSIKEALDDEVAESNNGSKVEKEHIILTKCPELGEVLRIARGYTTEQGATYEYDCGTFFIDNELTEMLKACKEFCHAAKCNKQCGIMQ